MRFAWLCAGAFVLALLMPVSAQDGAEVRFEDQTSQGTTVVVAHVELPDGGYVAIHDERLLDGDAIGSVVGHSEFLEAGSHEDVSVTIDRFDGESTFFAMAHKETNGNQAYDFVTSQGEDDGPYMAGGEIVMTQATLQWGEPPSVRFDDQRLDGGGVWVDAFLPAGGYVAIHDKRLLDGDAVGSVVGHSAFLEPGQHRVKVAIDTQEAGTYHAMAHHETNGNRTYDFVTSGGKDDGPSMAGGEIVMDQAKLEAAGHGHTVGADREDEPEGDRDTPGPALVLLALALVGAALLVRRR